MLDFADGDVLSSDRPEQGAAREHQEYRRERLAPRHLLFVLAVFALTRALVLLGVTVGPDVVPRATYAIAADIDEPLLRPLVRWDSFWYLSIARDGYRYNGDPTQEQNIVFFPLYPLSMRLCHAATGLTPPWCGLGLSNVAFLAALVILFGLIASELSHAVARLAIVFLATFPGGLFFSLIYTESFFLLFSVLAFTSFRRHHFLLGGLWAGLASATRAQGLLLLVPLMIEVLATAKNSRMWVTAAAGGLVCASGAGLFSIYQWLAFGDPLAFAHVQQQASGWQRRFAWPVGGPDIWWGLRQTFVPGLSPFPPFPVDTWLLAPFPIDAWMTLLFIALAIWMARQDVPLSYPAYLLAGIALPLCTVPGVWSMTRYLSVMFPAFMAMGIIASRARWTGWALPPAFAVVLVLFAMRFAQWHWVD